MLHWQRRLGKRDLKVFCRGARSSEEDLKKSEESLLKKEVKWEGCWRPPRCGAGHRFAGSRFLREVRGEFKREVWIGWGSEEFINKKRKKVYCKIKWSFVEWKRLKKVYVWEESLRKVYFKKLEGVYLGEKIWGRSEDHALGDKSPKKVYFEEKWESSEVERNGVSALRVNYATLKKSAQINLLWSWNIYLHIIQNDRH